MSEETQTLPDYPLPNHLGGHLFKTHIDGGTLRHLKRAFDIKTMIDIGCSIGEMLRVANDIGIEAEGVDGDFTLSEYWVENHLRVCVHDFTQGTPEFFKDVFYDLAWSVEFVNQVEEKYMDNYMPVFQQCKYVICSASGPELGAGSSRNVNLQTQDYWVQKFDEYGFEFDLEQSEKVRRISTMKKPFMQRTGMFFKRKGV